MIVMSSVGVLEINKVLSSKTLFNGGHDPSLFNFLFSIQQHGQQGHPDEQIINGLPKIHRSWIAVYDFIQLHGAGQRMEDHGIRLHMPQDRGVYSIPLEAANISNALRTDTRLVNHVHFADYTIDVRFQFIASSMVIQIIQDIGFHLELWRTNKENLNPLEFR